MRPLKWFFALKPHVKVGLVTMALVLSGIAVLIVSLNRIDSAQQPADRAATSTLPALAELQKLSQGQELINAKFNTMLTEPDAATRVIMLEDIRRQLSLNEEAWRNFRALAVGFSDEPGLWGSYDEAMDTQKKLAGPVGLGIISGAMEKKDASVLFADSTFIELRGSQRKLQDAVDQLIRLYTTRAQGEVRQSVDIAQTGKRDILIAFSVVMVFSSIVAIASFRSARNNQRDLEVREKRRAEDSRRNELEARLYRALEMAKGEDGAFDLVGQALVETLPGRPAELLVADNSEAHFRQVLSTDVDGRGPGCAVVAPGDCPATHRGDTLVFGSSDDLDACPYLRGRSGSACTAVCQPVSIAGKSIGVIHATSAVDEPFSEQALVDLELVARRAGERIGMLRAFAESESQARTDPLTGLLNRRSLENTVRRLVADSVPYIVAFGDLDHFKQLNDTFGHEIGDRALRLFTKALRDSIRPNDLACRYGGEEFVIVIPDCALEEAVRVVERVRISLASNLEGGRLPEFTVSFGVASSRQADSFDRVVSLADAALLHSKSAGRDRVTVSNGGRAALPPGSQPELTAPSEF